MGVVYLAYCGSWQLSLHVPCFCAFYIFNTTPNPTSSSFFQNVFVLVIIMCMHIHEAGSLPELLVYSLKRSCLFWQCTTPKYRLQIHPLTLYLIESLETGVEVGQMGLPDTSLVLKPFEVRRVLETL